MAGCLVLAACGGGGDGGYVGSALPAGLQAAGAVAPSTLEAKPATDDDGLVATPPEVMDATRTGQRMVKAVSGLDDGGHVVVWMSREPGDPGTSWLLWVQRFDAQGRKRGVATRLDYPSDVAGPQDVAVTVLPEGRIGVSFVTDRVQDMAFAITQVEYWPFNLEGSINGEVRVLDAERYARFSPRLARLAGPLTAAVGRDGSQFLAWRYQVVGAAPLAPSVRAQRLAADGEPLGWIQRLDGAGRLSQVADVQISPLDEGGWVVALERTAPIGMAYLDFVQLEPARPLELPLSYAHSEGSFLLDLRGRGSVLFTRALDLETGVAGAPLSIHFNVRGQAQVPRTLERLPVAAVALRGGDYLAFDPQGGVLVAQRFTPAGRPVGPAFATEAVPGALVSGLRRGGLALAWVTTTPDGEVQVVSQRFSRPLESGDAPDRP